LIGTAMKATITKSTVDAIRADAKATGKTIYCWDADVTGFGFYATRTGACSYFVEYRLGGRGTPNKRMSIGKHGVLTPKQARDLAKEELGKVSGGIDVARVKKDGRLKLAAGTFKEIAESYLSKEGKSSRYWKEQRSILQRDCYPAFGGQAISTITKQQIRSQLDKVSGRAPSAERKLFSVLSPLFKWAAERGAPETNPVAGLKRPRPAAKRKRVLDQDEIKAFGAAALNAGPEFSALYRLLLLTGQRREEVAGMRWEEIDLENSIWRLPPKEEFQPQRTKNGLEHILDLNPQAMAILEALPGAREGLVFTTTGTTPVSGFGNIKRRLDAHMQKTLRKPLKPWRNHDLRRTLSTHMADHLGIDEGVIDRIQNHVTGVSDGLRGVYQQQQYREKRKAAMIAWGAYIERLVTGSAPDNVVCLDGARKSA
jgi:integrase